MRMIDTMHNYMNDYQQLLDPKITDLLVQRLLDNFIITYLTSLHTSPKLSVPDAGLRMKEDILEAFRFFDPLMAPNDLDTSFEVLEMAHGLVTASREMFPLSFWAFAKVHGPNLGFVEGILRARDDLDRSAVEEVMKRVRWQVAGQHLNDREFSPLASSASRYFLSAAGEKGRTLTPT